MSRPRGRYRRHDNRIPLALRRPRSALYGIDSAGNLEQLYQDRPERNAPVPDPVTGGRWSTVPLSAYRAIGADGTAGETGHDAVS